MSHLLVVSIGPVQDFIAAARRTRDLWFGSQLLSEISKAAAKKLAESDGVRLIFPALNNDAPEFSNPQFNVANVILAEVTNGDPKTLSESAKKAAQKKWRNIAAQVKQNIQNSIRNEVWDAQVEDVIECYAAWYPVNGNYSEARKQLMRLLAGRKALRDFIQPNGLAGVPKSSLDGARESVINENRNGLPRWSRIKDNEQLDVVGLVKRLGGGQQGFTSVSRVAADPWLIGIALDPQTYDSFFQISTICEELCANGLLTRAPQYQDFPYEGAVIYPSRHPDLEKSGVEKAQLQEISQSLQEIRRSGHGEPNPYFAVLLADGDRMGKAISERGSADEHRKLSTALSGFASKAGEIVKQHQGALVYAGGDDVLAFVPVDLCLECAQALHDSFSASLTGYDTEEGPPTLSVGIAIGHHLEPLEDLLAWAREAEKDAKKPDRNGLAIHLHTRGGAPTKVRGQWESGIYGRLKKGWETYMKGALSDKAAYDLRELANQYDSDWAKDKPENEKAETRQAQLNAMKADAIRVLNRKSGGRDLTGVLDGLLPTQPEPNPNGDAGEVKPNTILMRFAEELIIARMIAGVKKQAGDRPPVEGEEQHNA